MHSGFCFPLGAEGWGVFQYSILLRTYTPTKELYNIYDSENDLRVQEKQYFHTSYTYIKDGKEITQTFDASPYVWYNEEALLSTGKNGKDLPIYRYPEILLIAAEAIAESEGVTSEANRGKVTYRNVIGATNPWGATFEEKHLLWPISHNEIQRNPALEQNPGYDR
ncbi:RagB/SusD family nutrient uptake outer membrane protein [Parabacteroides johnsonii]|uniref:RagB/SusD family nutrient uptake outer membrane protein n=1 Tax=Parabacteroides johnsonii TaxID=387661 RepID=UPI0021CB74F7|nr:RagB/SusD family nutrient uptake outer membrane protein [Parabacteroides johnsonii]